MFLTSCLALCETVSRPQFSAQSLYSNSLAPVHFTCFSNSFALQKRTSPLVGQSAKVCELRRNEKMNPLNFGFFFHVKLPAGTRLHQFSFKGGVG